MHQRLAPFLARDLGLDEATILRSEELSELIPLVRDRIRLLTDATPFVDWLFKQAADLQYDAQLLVDKKLTSAQTLQLLAAGSAMINEASEFSTKALETAFRAKSEELGIKVGPFLTAFRVAITGKTISPPLFESMMALGKVETLARLRRAVQKLQGGE